MRFTYLLLTAFSLALLLTACGEKDQAARSIEQIYAEEGVPVRVLTLAHQPFETSLTYNAVLTGIEESSALAT
ncbi:MAG: efflux RND transporter periplasmic adaptor subunit, partial [Calditrichales bacterium]